MVYNKYKVIIIGDSGIGKTTIMNSYLKKILKILNQQWELNIQI
jgi:GTPase SAR1 family protein